MGAVYLVVVVCVSKENRCRTFSVGGVFVSEGTGFCSFCMLSCS